jgi:cobalamin synthase
MKWGRIFAIFFLVFLLLAGIVLLFYACAHHHNWWSIFVLLSAIVTFYSPAICYNYRTDDDTPVGMDHIDEQRMKTCRELGWTVALVVFLFSYGIPVLAWHGSGFAWAGVVMVHVALTCFAWSYVLWLKMFVFVK